MDIALGFIGTGAMGSAMIKSVSRSGILAAGSIKIYDTDSSKTSAISKETGAGVCGSAAEIARESDIIVLAVKPNVLESVLNSIKDFLDDKKIIVSFAVGIPISFYKNIVGKDKKVVRTMPNTPMQVNEGMTLISHDSSTEESEIEAVKRLFECTGRVEILDERLMSEVTALTGSSPAYVYIFIEAMADAAVQSGIPRALAYRLAAQAVLGSAKMVLETGRHPAELKDQVCSPAGTTIDAVSSLERNGFRHAIIDAMGECTKRAREIGKIYG